MGCLFCCFPDDYESQENDDTIIEERRRRQLEAAEKRKKEAEHRGVKNPEKLKLKQRRKEAAEKDAATYGYGDTNLKWSVG